MSAAFDSCAIDPRLIGGESLTAGYR